MRKGLSISVILILLVATLGISVSKHYCGNLLRNASLYLTAENCGDMEMPGDCCDDEHEVYQLDVDYQLISIDHDIHPDFIILQPLYNAYLADVNLNQYIFQNPANHSPPPGTPEVYIRFQSFLL